MHRGLTTDTSKNTTFLISTQTVQQKKNNEIAVQQMQFVFQMQKSHFVRLIRFETSCNTLKVI